MVLHYSAVSSLIALIAALIDGKRADLKVEMAVSKRPACWSLILALSLLVCACSARSPADPQSDLSERPAQIRVADESGPLDGRHAAAVVERLEHEDQSGLLARHLREVDAVMKTPLVLGNSAHLLIDGPQTQQAMLRAIAEARKHIDLETYILEPIGMGESLAALLEAKRAEAVTVRVIYDSVGSLSTPKEYFERLIAAGAAVCEFNPVNPLRMQGDARLGLNNRDHRKLLIVDNRIAFTGGINISSVYSSSSFSRKHSAPSPEKGWRDTHVLVRGPVVDQFQKLFDDTWHNQGCPGDNKTGQRAQPPALRTGDMAMRLVAADPLTERSELYLALLSAIEHASRRIWLTYGYFAPDDRILGALHDAARRGVDVRLVLPGFSDFWAPLHAGRSHYSGLLASDIRIFERRDALLHAKTAVIDGVWSSVGSTNLDWRSFLLNYEADLLVLDSTFAGEMEDLFRIDQSTSHEILEKEWARRGIGSRLLEWLARRWEHLL